MGYWELIRVFKVFWFIPLLLTGSISSQPPLLGRFFPFSIHGVGMTLLQIKVVSLGLTARRCYFWKLSRMYPGEKQPSLSVLTHRDCLAMRKPTQHLLAMARILVRIRALYECPMDSSVPPARELRHHLSQDFYFILRKRNKCKLKFNILI